MHFTSFERGLRSELSNREFALVGVTAAALRTRIHESAPFWRAYERLERFSAPRYRAAAERMGIPGVGSVRARIRGRLVGWLPNILRRESIRFALPRTIEYAEGLRRLAETGPLQEREFCRYMIRQEELQVRMMEEMLRGHYAVVERMVDEFIEQESD